MELRSNITTQQKRKKSFHFLTHITVILLGISLAPLSFAKDERWQYELSTYIWLPETTTGIETTQGSTETTLSVSDALDSLDVGYMLTATATRNSWTLVGDLVYLNLEAETNTPFGQLYRDLKSETTLSIFSTYGLYSIVDNENFFIDIGLGLRAVDSDVDATFTAGLLPSVKSGISDNWVDPVVAARFYGKLSEKLFASVTFDTGGFGGSSASDSTWQALALLGYSLTENWTIRGGYRHLYIDRENDGQRYDFEMSGFVFGVSYQF